MGFIIKMLVLSDILKQIKMKYLILSILLTSCSTSYLITSKEVNQKGNTFRYQYQMNELNDTNSIKIDTDKNYSLKDTVVFYKY